MPIVRNDPSAPGTVNSCGSTTENGLASNEEPMTSPMRDPATTGTGVIGRPGLARGSGVELLDARRQAHEEFLADRRRLIEQREEVAALEDRDLELRVRNHRGVARSAVEHRELTDHAARGDLPDPAPFAGHAAL